MNPNELLSDTDIARMIQLHENVAIQLKSILHVDAGRDHLHSEFYQKSVDIKKIHEENARIIHNVQPGKPPRSVTVPLKGGVQQSPAEYFQSQLKMFNDNVEHINMLMSALRTMMGSEEKKKKSDSKNGVEKEKA